MNDFLKWAKERAKELDAANLKSLQDYGFTPPNAMQNFSGYNPQQALDLGSGPRSVQSLMQEAPPVQSAPKYNLSAVLELGQGPLSEQAVDQLAADAQTVQSPVEQFRATMTPTLLNPSFLGPEGTDKRDLIDRSRKRMRQEDEQNRQIEAAIARYEAVAPQYERAREREYSRDLFERTAAQDTLEKYGKEYRETRELLQGFGIDPENAREDWNDAKRWKDAQWVKNVEAALDRYEKAAEQRETDIGRQNSRDLQERVSARQKLPSSEKEYSDARAALQELGLDPDNARSLWNKRKPERDALRLKEYAALRLEPDFKEKSGYVPEPTGYEPTAWERINDQGGLGKWKYPLYEYINGNEEAGAALFQSGRGNLESGQLSKSEREIFNYLYHTQGRDAAGTFYDAITGTLNARQRRELTEYFQNFAAENPVGASALSIAASPLKGLSYGGQALDYLATGRVDQNAGYNRFSYENTAMRNQVAQAIENGSWGKAGSFLYQTGMSMGDFLLNTGLTGGNQTLTLAIMGAGAAADSTISAKDRGLSDDKAFTVGTIAGIAEILTEKVSLETLLNKTGEGRKALIYILKNVLAEGSEEVASSAINLTADVLVSKSKGQWQERINAYRAQGMKSDEAFWRAVADQAIEMGLEGLGGGVSGGVLASGRVALNSALGGPRTINSDGAPLAEMGNADLGYELKRLGLQNQTIDAGLAYPDGTDARKRALRLLNQKIVTDGQLGLLFRAIETEAGKAQQRQAELGGMRTDSMQSEYTLDVQPEADIQEGPQNAAETPREPPRAREVQTPAETPESQQTRQEGQQAGREALTGDAAYRYMVRLFSQVPEEQRPFSDMLYDNYDDTQDVNAYLDDMARVFNAGAQGAELDAVDAGSLHPEQLRTAWEAGRDASGIDVDQSFDYNQDMPNGQIRETEDFENGAESGSESGEWNDRVDSGRPGGELQESPGGETEESAVQERGSQSQEREAARFTDWREVNARQEGIEGSADDATVRIISESEWNDEIRDVHRRFASNGIQATFISGAVRLSDGTEARAVVSADNTRVWIQADNEDVSVTQAAEHEEYHIEQAKDPSLNSRVRNSIIEKYGEERLTVLSDAYSDAYDGANMTDAQILEEIFADNYAGIDIFDYLTAYEGATQFGDSARQQVRQGPRRATAAETAARTETPEARDAETEKPQTDADEVTMQESEIDKATDEAPPKPEETEEESNDGENEVVSRRGTVRGRRTGREGPGTADTASEESRSVPGDRDSGESGVRQGNAESGQPGRDGSRNRQGDSARLLSGINEGGAAQEDGGTVPGFRGERGRDGRGDSGGTARDDLRGVEAENTKEENAEIETSQTEEAKEDTKQESPEPDKEEAPENKEQEEENSEKQEPEKASEETREEQQEQNAEQPDTVKEEQAPERNKEKKPPAKKNRNKNNYRINPENIENKLPNFNDNVEAIKLLKKLESEGRNATPEERAVLAKYKGWGGLKSAVLQDNYQSRQLRQILTPEEFRAARESVLNAHYTSPTVIGAVYSALERMGFKGGDVLEPSMGVGNFFGLMPEKLSRASDLYGVELDSITGRIAQQLYPDAKIDVAGFENVLYPDNTFDAVVGNVPFSNDVRVSYRGKSYALHDFFFLKALDETRPGGVVALITSTGTLDKLSGVTQAQIADRANLVAAFRLPDTAFARNAGTRVTTDLIFLQKKGGDIEDNGVKFQKIVEVDGTPINEYFASNPENILGELAYEKGMYQSARAVVHSTSMEDFKSRLDDAVKRLPQNIMQENAEAKATVKAKKRGERTRSTFRVTEKGAAIVDKRTGEVTEVNGATKAEQKKLDTIKDFVALRTAYGALMDVEQSGNTDGAEEFRKRLNAVYDRFVERHGPVSSAANKRILGADDDYIRVTGLEIQKKDTIEKSSIFERPTVSRARKTSAGTADEALSVVLNEDGRVDVNRIAELTGKPRDEVISELGGEIVFTPDGEYVLRAQYVSGNIYEKLAQVDGRPEFAEQKKLLEAALPRRKGVGEVRPTLGSHWIAPEYVQQFFNEVFRPYSPIVVEYNRALGTWAVSRFYSNVSEFGSDSVSQYDTALNTLLGKNTTVYQKDEDGVRTLDKKATAVAQQKQDNLRRAFEDWIFKDKKRTEAVLDAYNRTLNAVAPMDYTSLGQRLDFGISPDSKKQPRDYQKTAIARVVFGGNVLLHHGVGTGKTLTMIVSAHVMKQNGIANKPLFVVPNGKVNDFRNEILELYPDANVLALDNQSMTPKEVQRAKAQIATGDWDYVLIYHSAFNKLSVKPETEAAFLQRQLDRYEEAYRENAQGKTGNRFEKALVTKIKNLQSRIEKVLEAKKDDTTYFEDMGIDAIFVDEAHNFKKVGFPTSFQISGIDSDSNAKTTDLYMKENYLREHGGKIVLGTATPITNTLSEMYNMALHVAPEVYGSAGVENFDTWLNSFANIDAQPEIGPDGKTWRIKERVRGFKNGNELVGLYRQFADVVQTKDVVEGLPEAEYIDVISPATDYNQALLDDFARRSESAGRGANKSDNMLVITNDGRAAGTDLRLLPKVFERLFPGVTQEQLDIPTSKINKCVDLVADEYRKSAGIKGTQFVFLDMGIHGGGTYDYNLYDDLIRKLVKAGIPRKEIANIQDYDGEEKRTKLYDAMNSGDIRVLIGSTAKMGEGVNAQGRAVALHHLSVPYRPDNLEQREGRIVRFGNVNKNVRIYRYIQEKSYDSYMWQMIERKAAYAAQALAGGDASDLEEVGDIELKAREAKGIATGNPLIVEKLTLQDRADKLNALYWNWQNEQYAARNAVASNPGKISGLEAELAAVKKDADTAKGAGDSFAMTLGKTTFDKRADAAKALTGKLNPKSFGKVIGKISGFEIMIRPVEMGESSIGFTLRGAYSYDGTFGDSPEGNLRRVENLVEKGPQSRQLYLKQQIKKLNGELSDARETLKKPFEQQKELEDVRARQLEVDRELGIIENESAVDLEQDGGVEEGARYSRDTASDLRRENAELRQRVERLRNEMRVTEKPAARDADVHALARKLIRENDSTLKGAEARAVEDGIRELWEFLQTGDPSAIYAEAKDRAVSIMRPVLDAAEVMTNSELVGTYSGLVKRLRNDPVVISAQDAADVSPEWKAWRDSHRGLVNVSVGGRGEAVDTRYAELSGAYPEFFPADITHPADQLLRMAEVAETLQPVFDNPYNYNMAVALEYAANGLLDSLLPGETSQVRDAPPTFADRAQTRLENAVEAERAKGERALERAEKRVTEQKEKRERTIATLKEVREKRDERIAEQKEKMKEALRKVREDRDNKISDLKQKFKNREIERKTKAKSRDLIRKITKHARELDKQLRNPTDKRHILDSLRGPVARVLEAINLADAYDVALDADGNAIGKVERGAEGGYIQTEPTKRTQAFAALKKAYGEIAGDLVVDWDLFGTDTDPGLFDQVISMADVSIRDMSVEQLETVWNVLKAVENSVKTANKMFRAERFKTVSSFANALHDDNVLKLGKEKTRSGGTIRRLLASDMILPVTYFHRLGTPGDAMFRMLRDAQDKHTTIMKRAVDFTNRIIKDFNVREVERTFHDVKLGGEEVRMSTAQLMELYVLAKRKQAMGHILTGGILPDAIHTRGKTVSMLEPLRGITIEELSDAVSKLGANEVRIAESLQRYLAFEMAKIGNEASMEVYGYKKFGEVDYWPIRSNRQEIRSDIEKDTQVTSVAGRGFTKATKPKADTSVRVGSIFSTFAQHVSEMATYASYLAPTEDINRIRNFTARDEAGNYVWTVKGILDSVQTGGAKYLQDLLSDVAIGVQGRNSGVEYIGSLLGNFKVSAIAANIRVFFQQPTAIIRAAEMISPLYLGAGLAATQKGVGVPLKAAFDGWSKAVKYAPIARWKSWGYFDVGLGRNMESLLFKSDSFVHKINNALASPSGFFDSFAWGQLWNAVELETKRQRRELLPGTEEFYNEVAKRFTEIIDRTQVVDGILQRSPVMRSQDKLDKIATAFMSEPIKQYNQFVSAVNAVRDAPKGGRRNVNLHLARTSVTLLASFIVNAAVQSIVDALRDDDREKGYWERWWKAMFGVSGDEKGAKEIALAILGGNLLNSINPLSFMPYFKDILSLLQGYDVNRMDMEGIDQTLASGDKVLGSLSGNGKYTVKNSIFDFAASVSRLVGIPVSNIKRDALAIANTYATGSDNFLMQYEMDKLLYNVGSSQNQARYINILYRAFITDKEQYQILHERMIADGIPSDKLIAGMRRQFEKHGNGYDSLYQVYKTEGPNSAEHKKQYNYLLDSGFFTETQIKNAMESRMKEEQGVTKVSELESRYLEPDR